MKRVLPILVSAAAVVVFVLAAFHSRPFRVCIAFVEPAVPFILFWGAIAASVYLTLKAGKEVRLRGPALRFLRKLLPAVAVVLFLMPLFRGWSNGSLGNSHEYNAIGGLVPWADAAKYHRGAYHLLVDGELDRTSMRRPLYVGLFAVQLRMAGYGTRGAMVIQAALLGLACWWAARAVAADCGDLMGIAFFALLLAFGRIYAPVALTESLGLTLGALGFAVVRRGIRAGTAWLIPAGCGLWTLGFCVRPMAFMFFPLLLVWAGVAYRRTSYARIPLALICLAAVLSGFALNAVVNRAYGKRWKMGHDTFPHALNALASGGTQHTDDRDPGMSSMNDDQKLSFAYAQAFRRIRQRPMDLVSALAGNAVNSSVLFAWEMQGLALGDRLLSLGESRRYSAAWFLKAAGLLLVCGAFVFGAERYLVSGIRDPGASFVLAGLAGLILSLPFIYHDSGKRLIAASLPFVAFAMASIISLWYPRRESAEGAPAGDRDAYAPLATGILLAVAALAGPAVAAGTSDIRPVEPVRCEDGCIPIVAVTGPGSPCVEIPASVSTDTFSPVVNERDFRADTELTTRDPELYRDLSSVEGPATVLWVYDLQRPPGPVRSCVVIAPPGTVTSRRRLLLLCVLPAAAGRLHRVKDCRPYEVLEKYQ